MYFELANKIKCKAYGKGVFLQVQQDGTRVPITRCSITVPPAVKHLYTSRTQKDILCEIKSIVESVDNINSVKIAHRAVHFIVPHIPDINQREPLRLKLREANKVWSKVLQDSRPDSLQRRVLALLKDREFERVAFMHHAATHGIDDCNKIQAIRQEMDVWL